MDQQNLSVPASTQVSPVRRLVAAGFIRRLGARTFTVCVTEAGVTGRIIPATSGGPVCCGRPMHADHGQYVCDRCDPGTTTRAARVAALNRACRADYASSADRRAADHYDVFLLAAASEAVTGQ